MRVFRCENAVHGCARTFSTKYGAAVHRRACISTNKLGKIAKSRRKPKLRIPNTLGGRSRRLINDAIAFSGIDYDAYVTQGDIEEPIISDDTNDTNIWNIISQETKEEIENEEESKDPCSVKKLGRLFAYISSRAGSRVVNMALAVMRARDFDMNAFNEACKTTADCVNLVEKECRNQIKIHGFEYRSIVEPSQGIRFEMYMRSPVSSLSNQIKGATRREILFHPTRPDKGDLEEFCHPMMSELGQLGVPAVRNEIIRCKEENVRWREKDDIDGESFVGLVQLYSDKSKTSLSDNAFTFYPIHATLLNFSEEYRRHLISSGQTFLAFLPVKFYKQVGNQWVETKLSRDERMLVLHYAIDLSLEELKRKAFSGFLCVDKERNRKYCHVCLAAYCCDLPEAKDLLMVRNGNLSTRNCHRCLAYTKDFPTYTEEPHRRVNNIIEAVHRSQQERRHGRIQEYNNILDDLSISSRLSPLFSFPFSKSHPVLDSHIIFTYESLHNFHLGVSKDLKRAVAERLRSADLVTSAIPSQNGNQRVTAFRNVRSLILSGINKLLAHMQISSQTSGLNLSFCLGEHSLYNDQGNLIGMLEGKHYKAIDAVSPFIGMFLDRSSDESITAPSTSIFVQYSDLTRSVLGYDKMPVWTTQKIAKLKEKIKKFKRDSVALYGSYQTSGFKTEKFHLLDHICDDIQRMGGIKTGDAGLYESTHTRVKAAYKASSKRKFTVMRDSMGLFVKELFGAYETSIGPHDLFRSEKNSRSMHRSWIPKFARGESLACDSASLVRHGKPFTLNEVRSARKVQRLMRKARENGTIIEEKRAHDQWSCVTPTVRELLQDIGEEAARSLCYQLDQGSLASCNTTGDIKMIRVLSGYVAGHTPPAASQYNETQTSLLLGDASERISQRVVSGKFYGSQYTRQDCVLLQGPETESESQIEVWVAKVLLLFRIHDNSARKHVEYTEENRCNEWAFVQYFNIIPLEDDIDKTLNCVRLEWARVSSANDEQPLRSLNSSPEEEIMNASKKQATTTSGSSMKWFDMVPVGSFRGVVHVVRGDYGMSGRGILTDMDDVEWEHQHFYINRFHYDSTERNYDFDDKEDVSRS